jgi:1,4-dihydroxy-2-naphthoate octaprenyltransferase
MLVLIGLAVARHDGFADAKSAWLLLAGVLSAHASANLFNELSDIRTGIDSRTQRTPFSGGSGMMQSGATSPQCVRTTAYGLLVASALIGLYFCFRSGWLILFFMVCGGAAVRFYTSVLSRWLLGEIASGLTLGTFVVLGVYFALARTISPEAVFISIPPGILTSLLLFLNEFPDADADKSGGRHHVVITLGKSKSAVVYAVGMMAVYGCLFAAPWVVRAPKILWIALATSPLAFMAVGLSIRHHHDFKKMVMAQGLNTLVVIVTDLLIVLAYLVHHPV